MVCSLFRLAFLTKCHANACWLVLKNGWVLAVLFLMARLFCWLIEWAKSRLKEDGSAPWTPLSCPKSSSCRVHLAKLFLPKLMTIRSKNGLRLSKWLVLFLFIARYSCCEINLSYFLEDEFPKLTWKFVLKKNHFISNEGVSRDFVSPV